MEKGNKMGMVAFNHNISEELAKDYDKIFTDLPGMKYEILEAALRAFKSLPEPLQYKLLSGNPEKKI